MPAHNITKLARSLVSVTDHYMLTLECSMYMHVPKCLESSKYNDIISILLNITIE